MKAGKRFSFLNILIIFLSVILAFSIFITFQRLREDSRSYYDNESSLYYDLTDHDYAGIASRYYDNAVGNEQNPKVKKVADYYAVGRFFEKAFFANAFMKAQDPEREAFYRQQMEEAESEMGQFSGEKQQILALFPDLMEGGN